MVGHINNHYLNILTLLIFFYQITVYSITNLYTNLYLTL